MADSSGSNINIWLTEQQKILLSVIMTPLRECMSFFKVVNTWPLKSSRESVIAPLLIAAASSTYLPWKNPTLRAITSAPLV